MAGQTITKLGRGMENKPITIADLKGCYPTRLAQKPNGLVTLAAELRINRDGFSWWFWVFDGRDGLSPTKKETQNIATAIRWYNQIERVGE